jgi:hypothetical protein
MSCKSRRILLGFLAFLLLVAMTVLADESSDVSQKLGIKGYASWQFGQIVKGEDREKGPIENAWQNGVLIGLTFNARPNDHLGLVVSPEFYLNYPYPQDSREPASARPLGTTYINEAYGKFSFGDAENPFLQAKLGMFVFKYNPDGRNFGDYLFRTGTYPTWIINNFDFPAARLLGLHLSSDPLKIEQIINLHFDALFTSEAFIFPFGDFSLTAMLTGKFFDAIELGAGIDFARLLSVTDTLTSPIWDVGNSNTNTPNVFLTTQGTIDYYSFKATKVMALASIDPKPLFGSPKWLGPEDLKLYGEVCWVGIGGYNEFPLEMFDTAHNHPYRPWYKSLNERTPRMVGFNWPTHPLMSYTVLPGIVTYGLNKKMAPILISAGTGIISGIGLWWLGKQLGIKTGPDVISGELEYFPSVYPNDYRSNVFSRSPLPYFKQGLTEYNKDDWDQGAWRWSLYARKMIINGFSVSGEIAFDHLRTTYVDGSTREYECLTEKGHWHWNAKFSYAF